ncbi:MAG: 50S ribosomal protein L7/L12 [Candidatus Atribacteria bacterium]|nr:50S ribosomal protein L7/L12 [Candidatus Atribacteria bacterium]MCK4308830.1 50S ribosomal protein L7/L12 [Candidatus Atribacteria bacterium]
MVEKKKASEEEKKVVSKKVEKSNVKKESTAPKGTSDEILEKIEKMTVLELADLVKDLEEKFGVTAAMPTAMPANTGSVAAPGEAKEEEKTDFEVVLKEIGPNKIKVIKEIRTITALGLKESKDLVEGAPNSVKEHVDKKAAEEIKEKLEAVGAVVEIK